LKLSTIERRKREKEKGGDTNSLEALGSEHLDNCRQHGIEAHRGEGERREGGREEEREGGERRDGKKREDTNKRNLEALGREFLDNCRQHGIEALHNILCYCIAVKVNHRCNISVVVLINK
jgi:hypothetical protein